MKIWFSKKGSAFLWYLLSIGIPLFLIFSWHQLNNFYPRGDAANYLNNAQDIVQCFKNNDFLHGLRCVYIFPAWQPIFFPFLATPFLALSNGDVFTTVSLTLSLIFCIFLTYTYLLSREFLSPLRSCVVTLFVSSIPWIVNYFYIFYSDFALVCCALAVIYYIKKDPYFTSPKYSLLLGFSTAAGICMRPVEFFLALGIHLVAVIVLSLKKGTIKRSDLLVCSCILFLTILILGLSMLTNIRVRYLWGSLIVLLSLSIMFRFSFKKLEINRLFLNAFFMCNFLSVCWWLPRIKLLSVWLYQTSFGPMNRLYPGGTRNFREGLSQLLSTYGGYPLLFLTSICLIGILGTWKRTQHATRIILLPFAVIVCMILPYLIILSCFSGGSAFRRIFTGCSVLFIVMLIIAIHQRFILPKLRFLLISIFTLVQLVVVTNNTFTIFPSLMETNPFFPNTQRPFRGQDPIEETFAYIKNPLNPYCPKSIKNAFLQMPSTGYSLIDGWTLNVLFHKQGCTEWWFDYPWNFIRLEDGYRQLSQDFEFVLINVSLPSHFRANQSKLRPDAKLVFDIIQKWQNKQLESSGLKLISSFSVANQQILLMSTCHDCEIIGDSEKISDSMPLR